MSTFGRAIFEVGASKTQFSSTVKAADAEAQAISKSIDSWLGKAGDTLGDGVKAGSAQFDQQLQRAETRAKESSGRISEEFKKFGGRLSEGLALGGGIAAADAIIGGVTRLFEGAKAAAIDYNAELQTVTGQLTAYTGSSIKANDAIALARKEAAAGRGSFLDLASAIATLTPAAKVSGESMGDLLKLVETLAATNPAEGIAGAAYALREISAGDVTSIADRFNVSRGAIQKYRSEGVGNIEAVRRALDDMGITFDIVNQHAENFTTLVSRLGGLGQQTIGAALKPVFDELSQSLVGVLALLGRPEVQQAGADFAKRLTDGLHAVNEALANPATEQGLKALVSNLGILAQVTNDIVKAEGALLSVLGPLPTILGQVANVTGTLIHQFSELKIGMVTGKDVIVQLIEQLHGLGPTVQLANLITQLREFIRLKTEADAKDRKQEPKVIDGQTVTAYPVAGPNPSAGVNPTPESSPTLTQVTPDHNRTNVVQDVSENYAQDYAGAGSKAILARDAAAEKAATDGARNAALAYVRTFTSTTLSAFNEAKGVLDNALAAAVGGDATKIDKRQQAEGYALIARAMAEIQQNGVASEQTIAALSERIGGGAVAVNAYIEAYGRYAAAQSAVEDTTKRLTAAQQNLATVQKENTAAIKVAQEALDEAGRRRTANAQQVTNQIKGQTDAIAALKEEAAAAAQATSDLVDEQSRLLRTQQRTAQDASRDRQEVIRGAQADLAAIQRQASAAAAERQRQADAAAAESQRQAAAASAAFQAQADAIQARIKASQDLAAEHAAAFKAIQDGTLGDFYAEHDAIDESTRLIIARYDAEVAGKIAAKNAASANVDRIDTQERRRELELLTQIRAERGRGDYAAAAETERQLQRERARYQNRSEYARLQAQVAGDDAKNALQGVADAGKQQAADDRRVTTVAQREAEQAAANRKAQEEQAAANRKAQEEQAAANRKAQEEQDKAQIDAQQAYIAGLSEEDRVRTEADKRAAQAISDRITQLQDEGTEQARNYKDREAAHTKTITEIEQRAAVQKSADDAAYNAAQGILTLVKGQATARQEAAQKLVDTANDQLRAAQLEAFETGKTLQNVKDRIKAIQDFAAQYPGKDLNLSPLDGSRQTPEQIAAQPSAQGGTTDERADRRGDNGAPSPPGDTPPAAPGFFAPRSGKISIPGDLPGGGMTGTGGPQLASFANASFNRASLAGVGSPGSVAIPILLPASGARAAGTAGDVAQGGDTNIFHAPLVDNSGMVVDSDDRARQVMQGTLAGITKLLGQRANRGADTRVR